MSLILKIDGDPVWLAPQSHSYSGTVILLHGHDVHGQPVDVPADLLLAVSPLLRSILSAGHLPPAYYQPAISLPSVTYQVLQIVKELFSSGMVSIDKRTKVTEIQSVFKMLGIGVELICDQLQGVKMENEEVEEYFEYGETEDEFSKVKIHQTVKSSDIVKVEPDSGVKLNGSSIRPSIASSPLYSCSIIPVPKILPDPNDQAKFCCYICKKKFSKAKELSKHASEQHKNKKLFGCLSCPFSAKSNSDIIEKIV